MITDANGAPVPDDTPVAWEPAVAEGSNAAVSTVSEERATANGTAWATFAVASTRNYETILVTVQAGDRRSTQRFIISPSDPSVPLSDSDSAQLVEFTHSVPSWKLLKVGDTFTITATITDYDGNLVTDGTDVAWTTFSSTAFTTISLDAQTASGSASATFRVAADVGGSVGVLLEAGDLVNYTEHYAGGTTVYNVGSYPEPPDDLALSLRLPMDSDDIIPTKSTLQVGAALTYTGQAQRLNVSDGTLRIAGGQEWESGRNRLLASGQLLPIWRSDPARWQHALRHAAGQTPFNYLSAYPDTCKGVSLDGQTDWACSVELDGATIHIPAGTPDGTFTISGVITVNGREYRDSLEVAVVAPDAIDEVAEVQFDFAEQERGANRGEPYPANVPVGGETKLRLKILNENDKASAEGSIGSILLSTTIGSLSTRIGGGCVGGGGAACQIPVSAITAANADQIDVILTHPGRDKSGRGEVRATVIAIDGESFAPPALSVAFAGEASSLAISEPAGSLLSTATDADDDRDLLKLTVSAADAAGNNVEVPYRAPRVIIRGPDGQVVTNGISAVWTEDGDDSDDAHDRFTRNAADAVEAAIRVTAEAESPLKLGVYTLELRTAGKSATREFTVVGDTDSVTLSEPRGELRVGGTISFTATLRDAEGNLAPDGTPVSWAERSTTESAVLVRLAADSVTTDGAAGANFLAVGPGSAVVSAESGGVREVALLSIAPAPTAATTAAQTPNVRQSLSSQGAPGIASWLGGAAISASELLDALSGISSIQRWHGGNWQRYAIADDGQATPGSTDFAIQPGAVLWLSR